LLLLLLLPLGLLTLVLERLTVLRIGQTRPRRALLVRLALIGNRLLLLLALLLLLLLRVPARSAIGVRLLTGNLIGRVAFRFEDDDGLSDDMTFHYFILPNTTVFLLTNFWSNTSVTEPGRIILQFATVTFSQRSQATWTQICPP